LKKKLNVKTSENEKLTLENFRLIKEIEKINEEKISLGLENDKLAQENERHRKILHDGVSHWKIPGEDRRIPPGLEVSGRKTPGENRKIPYGLEVSRRKIPGEANLDGRFLQDWSQVT